MERIGEIVANIEQLKELVLHFEHQVNLLRFDIVMAGPHDWAPLDLKTTTKEATVWSNRKQRQMKMMTWSSWTQLSMAARFIEGKIPLFHSLFSFFLWFLQSANKRHYNQPLMMAKIL